MLVGVNSVDLCILVIVVLVSMLCAYLLDFVAVFLDLVVFCWYCSFAVWLRALMNIVRLVWFSCSLGFVNMASCGIVVVCVCYCW